MDSHSWRNQLGSALIFALLGSFGTHAGQLTEFTRTNDLLNLPSPAGSEMTGPAGTVRIIIDVLSGGSAFDISGRTNQIYLFDRGTTHAFLTTTAQVSGTSTARWEFDTPSGHTSFTAAAWSYGNTPSTYYQIGSHYLTVTSAPSASGVTLAGDVTINYPTGGTVSQVVEGTENAWDAGTGSLTINTGAVDVAITITTNGTGNVVTNLTTDGSAVTMELGTVSSDANTLEGYTAQEVADLPRSTADLDFTTLTWAQTTSISRADGVFQRLVTEGPSWVRVPAGLTNSGYMINLEIAATTNPITFLPDNILIATNLYTYTNRTMSFLLHNAWDEETVGVYGLKRDND